MRVLVTGGSGTFGRAFLQHVLEQGADRAVCFARHEVEMAAVEAKLAHFENFRAFLGDVRDPDRLEMAMRGVDTVVHAAALKRIEQCERDPIEAVKTNVIGTKNVIEACLRTGVRRCVLLSTDKAVEPVNLYGSTKLVAERLVLAANNISGGRCSFSVARYGNIWGSRGSVVHRWREDIGAGLPIRITDPEATRYFMLPKEAVALVIKALTSEVASGVHLPTLPAYRVGDLAEAMGAKDMEIIGLPEWEKLHETMDGFTDSGLARRMTVDELREELRRLPFASLP